MIPGPFVDAWPTNSDWDQKLAKHLTSQSFNDLAEYVHQERQRHRVYPRAQDVFKAFRITAYAKTRVVILGQDPYHGPGQARGLSFSVSPDQKLPPSLRNIYRELADDIGISSPQSGNLETWAEQGVLLLNTVLTVREAEPQSHRGQGWELFTDSVIEELAASNRTIVFVLWGKPAQTKTKLIGDRHPIIRSSHPSPLSAHRGFLGSRPFSTINQFLIDSGQQPIHWQSVSSSSSV